MSKRAEIDDKGYNLGSLMIGSSGAMIKHWLISCQRVNLQKKKKVLALCGYETNENANQRR